MEPSSNSTKYLIMIVVLGILFIGSLIFGIWAYSSGLDYKNNSDQKAAAAVTAATSAQKTKLDAQYAEVAKQPFNSYKGPQTYGAVTFNYPKTWSALADESNSSQPINGYFYPYILPNTSDQTAFALRIELLDSDYASAVSGFDSQISDGSLKATAYMPPKMVGVANAQPGVKLDGNITQDFQGSLVIMKVRDKTLEISAQSKDYLNDFNSTVLASLTFLP